MPELRSETVLVASPQQISGDLGGEVVILGLAEGVYFGMNEVGAHVWQALQEPRTVADVVDSVVQVTSEEAFKMSRAVSSKEALFGGISTGANVQAAIRVAEQNPGKTIVTIGCSFGERYLSTPMFEGLMS